MTQATPNLYSPIGLATHQSTCYLDGYNNTLSEGLSVEAQLISLSEASRILGLGVTTLRTWCQQGHVKAQKNSNAQWIMSIDDAKQFLTNNRSGASASNRISASNRSIQSNHGRPKNSDEQKEVVSEGHLRDLRNSLEHERLLSAELRKQNRDLESQLIKLTAEIHALLSKETQGTLSRWFRK